MVRRIMSLRRKLRSGSRHHEPAIILTGMARRHEVMLIIGLAVAVRLVGFTAPYTSQHWIKQLQIAPIAKNFATKSLNILWPETDYSADRPGYIEIEFQLVTWLTGVLHRLLGTQEQQFVGREWVGRLVTIAFSVGSMVLLYRLMVIYLGPGPAAYGLLFFAFAPSNWYFSRVLMSEPLMIFFSIAVIYYFSCWLSTQSRRHFVLTAIAGALCFLVKLPATLLVIPLLYLAVQKYRSRTFAQPALWALALIALLPAAAYYLYVHGAIGEQYFTVGVGFGGGMWFSPRDLLRPGNWSLMTQRLVKDHLTPLGLALLPLGFFATSQPRIRYSLFHVWLGAVALYLVMVSGGNIRQNYYQLHLIPPAAALIGLGWERLVASHRFAPQLNLALIPMFLMLCIWGAEPMYDIYRPIQAAAKELNQIDPDREAVIIFPPGYGCLYYFNRPGWVGREGMGKPPNKVPPEDVPGPDYIDDRIRRRAKWLVSFTPDDGTAQPLLHQYVKDHFLSAAECKDYQIFDLAKTPEGKRYRPRDGDALKPSEPLWPAKPEG